MQKQFLIFFFVLFIFISVVSSLSVYVYSSSLQLTTQNSLTILYITIGCAFFCFIAMILERSFDNNLVTFVTHFKNNIAGLFYYFVLGSLVLGIILLPFLLFQKTLPLVIPYSIIILSCLCFIVGSIQAQHSTTTHYSVFIKNLPKSWEDKKVILVSDTHFGTTSRNEFAAKVVNTILSYDPDIILLAGDLYDGPKIETSSVTRELSRLTQHAQVFYSPGNHEGYGPHELFLQSARDAGFTALLDEKIEIDGVTIAGFNFRNNKDQTGIEEALKRVLPHNTQPTIAIYHEPVFFNVFEKYGVNLTVHGHTHNGQFWPNNFITKLVYKQYHYGLHMFNTMNVITTKGVGTAGPKVRLFNRPEIVVIEMKNITNKI